MEKKKVFTNGYYIVMSLEDPKVENMLVVYARENHICNYPVDWIEQVLKCFDQKFVEPRIIDIKDGKSGNFLFYDGKKANQFSWQLKEKDGHKKIDGKILELAKQNENSQGRE